MTDATAFETDPDKLVDEASGWAVALWKLAHRGLGDTQEASMHKAAKMARVTPNTIWKLRYRRPREIGASVYFRLKAAHIKHVQSLEAGVAENLQVLRSLPATPARARLVAQMEEFLRDTESAEAWGDAPDERADDDQSRNWR